MKLSINSKTLELFSVGPTPPNNLGRDFVGVQRYPPTHTFETAPQLDVLLVREGIGSMDPLPGGGKPDIDEHIELIRQAYCDADRRQPLKYLISVCSGTILLAKAGVLNGQRATTNKDGCATITVLGPKMHWVARARWMASGNIWTTSGVSAGTDGILAWMSSLLPENLVSYIVNTMEWTRAETADNDPFTEIFGCEDVPPKDAT